MVLENAFWRLQIDPKRGITSALDKGAGVTYPLEHTLMRYRMRPEVERGAGQHGGPLVLRIQAGARVIARTVQERYDWRDPALREDIPADRRTWDPGVT